MTFKFKMSALAFTALLLSPNLSIALQSNEDTSELGVSVASGVGVRSIVPIRLGVQKSFGRRLCTQSACWPVGGYWEGSVYHLQGKRALIPPNNRRGNKQLNAVAAACVLRMQPEESVWDLWPYVDVGFGLSWLSKKEISARELGISFQFEDRLGCGFRWGEKRQYDLSYRAVHFSNAFLGKKNHGINLHLLVLGYWF